MSNIILSNSWRWTDCFLDYYCVQDQQIKTLLYSRLLFPVSDIWFILSSGNGRNKKDKCMFLLYIQANSVSNSKGQKSKAAADSEGPGPSVEFSIKDLYAIQEIQAQEDLFKLIVKWVTSSEHKASRDMLQWKKLIWLSFNCSSLCPAIYGHLVSVQILCSYVTWLCFFSKSCFWSLDLVNEIINKQNMPPLICPWYLCVIS